MKNDINLKTLAEQYLAAKKYEDEAIAERRRIGKLIEAALPGPSEGSASDEIDGIKVSVTRKITRSIDNEKLQNDWEFISENVQRAFRWKAELNTKHYRALQELLTTELDEANKYITSKPSAPSIDVSIKE